MEVCALSELAEESARGSPCLLPKGSSTRNTGEGGYAWYLGPSSRETPGNPPPYLPTKDKQSHQNESVPRELVYSLICCWLRPSQFQALCEAPGAEINSTALQENRQRTRVKSML